MHVWPARTLASTAILLFVPAAPAQAAVDSSPHHPRELKPHATPLSPQNERKRPVRTDFHG
jgi:hypothetical protein